MPAFDAIVIGAGQAGPPSPSAWPRAGRRVAIVERDAVRRHLRQHRLHADQDAGRQRLGRAAWRAARRNYGVVRRRRGRRSTWRRVKARKDAVVARSRDGRRALARGPPRTAPSSAAMPASIGHTTVAVGDERARRADRSSSMSAAGPRCRRSRARRGALSDQQHRAASWTVLPRHLVDHRRQLYRPGIRADLPPLRLRGDGHRNGAAADPARG